MDAVIDQSREAIRAGSKSFAAAARLFDARTRTSVYMLYRWCRHCDDVIDGQTLGHGQKAGGAQAQRARLDELIAKTRSAHAGEPTTDPVFSAFQRVVRENEIPERYPLEHLEGFRMDVEGRRYAVLADTLQYCHHVAGVVGVMMALVMGVHDRDALRRASDLGIAFQLTNIARDVVEDAGAGRIYLPAQWLREAGIAPEGIAALENRAALARVVARLLDAAEPYYASAAVGITALRPRCAWAVATAKNVYREIGMRVLALGPRAWNERTVVPRSRKLYHVMAGAVEAAAAISIQRARPKPSRAELWTRD